MGLDWGCSWLSWSWKLGARGAGGWALEIVQISILGVFFYIPAGGFLGELVFFFVTFRDGICAYLLGGGGTEKVIL